MNYKKGDRVIVIACPIHPGQELPVHKYAQGEVFTVEDVYMASPSVIGPGAYASGRIVPISCIVPECSALKALYGLK